ncbi:unnamed protein product [Prorocentrum cordatum]|uniref:MIF4G domain-containing protein n=1 Tax=Prorocentrum cordatum TaxID=2364126 RepID=A0ABN9UR23_9DINO|nr:unnamed protein product [Polarella glacialis]
MSTTTHVEMLIKEVFEKATSQHHYIDMYADLCVLLSEYFALNPVGNDPKFSFKRLLLHECQGSFERNLKAPDLSGLDDPEERQLREFRHKRRVLGNIKLIGALLVRKMLAGKVFLAILAEFVGTPTSEAMECTAALLTVAGASFDTQDWAHHGRLDAIFAQLRSIARQPSCAPRTRCLLQDVFDLRASGWQARAQHGRAAAPSTLQEVGILQAVDLGLLP